ncbi:NAD(P)H-dependent oxidoreductase [Paraclostridium bifermentans]|uniref:NAD(P)H-dependent oxidoreductase n=1 Tax=Paraclostridium bifermentans TaxID=1490 RepID=UPI00359C578D
MSTTIIVSNPSKNSFSEEVLNSVIDGLSSKNKIYDVIDLYEDKFNPVMTKEEVNLYSKGETKDTLVKKYQAILKESDEIIFIFPIWHNNVPAILKGFFDKVFVKEFAFIEENKRPKGLLINIKSGMVITTSETDTDFIKNELGNPIENAIIKGTLNVVGMSNIKWLNNNLANENPNAKKAYLENIKNYIS